jgi:DNA-binding LacI/PurR family transcriptional regulator
MSDRLYDLPRGECARIARATGLSKITISRAIRGIQCGIPTAKAIEAATDGKVRALVLLGLDPHQKAS